MDRLCQRLASPTNTATVPPIPARRRKSAPIRAGALSARLTVTDPVTGQDCEVDILKEIFWRPIAQSPYGPVLAEEDVIGAKVRALGDRGAPRDLIDVFAACPGDGAPPTCLSRVRSTTSSRSHALPGPSDSCWPKNGTFSEAGPEDPTDSAM